MAIFQIMFGPPLSAMEWFVFFVSLCRWFFGVRFSATIRRFVFSVFFDNWTFLLHLSSFEGCAPVFFILSATRVLLFLSFVSTTNWSVVLFLRQIPESFVEDVTAIVDELTRQILIPFFFSPSLH